MRSVAIPWLVAVAVAVGCVQTNVALVDPAVAYQPTSPEAVRLFMTPDRVPGAYREIALLNSKGESGWTTEEEMINDQRKKAARVGANGIILGGIGEPNASTKILGAVLGTGSERTGKSVAIWVVADSARTYDICEGRSRNWQTGSAAPRSQPTRS